MKKALLKRLTASVLTGILLVSALPAFAEDEIIEEEYVICEDEAVEDAAEPVAAQSGDVLEEAGAADLIEDLDIAEAPKAAKEGNLWYDTDFGKFSDGGKSISYSHWYPSEITDWDEIPKPDDDSKRFVGYSLTKGGEVIEFPFLFEKAGTMLYAVWASNVKHTVTFSANGGKFFDGTTAASVQYTEGDVIDLAKAVEDGDVPCPMGGPGDFLGYSSTDGGDVLSSFEVTGDATLYAVWEDYSNCEHNWVLVESESTPATCTAGGKEVYVCSKCNIPDERLVDPLGHDFGEWTVTQPATCTAPGVETRSCSRCEEKENRNIAAKGHAWDDGVITTPATETADGVKTYTCAACGETRTEVIPKTGTSGEQGSQGGQSGQGGTGPAPVKPPVVQKTRYISGANAVAKGKKITLTLVNREGSVTWKTSNKKTATVSSSGVVSGKKKGKVTITATENGKTYRFAVRVIDPKLNKKSASLKVKKSVKLKVKNASGAPVTWTSSNPSVASVSASGKVKALKKGSCRIYAVVGGKKLSCKIKVKK